MSNRVPAHSSFLLPRVAHLACVSMWRPSAKAGSLAGPKATGPRSPTLFHGTQIDYAPFSCSNYFAPSHATMPTIATWDDLPRP